MATKSKELSIEDKLWQTADALRGSMDASEYRNVVLGLIFLKYVSDSFETRYAELVQTDYPEDAEDPDMYLAENIFWVFYKDLIISNNHWLLNKRNSMNASYIGYI